MLHKSNSMSMNINVSQLFVIGISTNTDVTNLSVTCPSKIKIIQSILYQVM